MSRLDPAIEERLVQFLALVYVRINWRRMRTSKSAYDIWNHRLRAAATRPTLGEFCSRLCNYFGLQSVPEEAVVYLEALRPHEAELLDLVYREHVPIATRAAMRAAEIKARRRGDAEQLSLLDRRRVGSSQPDLGQLDGEGVES